MITPLMQVDAEVERYLLLLGNKIRERGFTQLRVQQALGWGRSYISQLVTRTKALRIEQVLLILNVIGVEPAEFYAELYQQPRHAAGSHDASGANADEIAEIEQHLEHLIRLLLEKRVITSSDLRSAVAAAEQEGN